MLFGILPHATSKPVAFRDLDDLKRNVASQPGDRPWCTILLIGFPGARNVS